MMENITTTLQRLSLKEHAFIKVAENFTNIEKIIVFCSGLSGFDLENEVIHFNGGDVFMFKDAFGKYMSIGDESNVKSGDYIIKVKDGCTVLSASVVKALFDIN